MQRKEAIEIIKKNWPDSSFTMLREALETLIPELKESEDEKIRKNCIEYIKASCLDIDELNECIAWLEKRGTDISSFPEEQQVFMQKYVSLDKVTLIKLLAERDATIAEIIESFEKQGEQKVIIPKFRVGDVIRYDEDGEINRVVEIVEEGYKLEHGTHILCFNSQDYWELVEQKPTDKVEPKFHEGEWVVDKQGLIHQIERVVENVTTHTFGYDIVGGGYFNDNNEGVHLWTIQDAKAGDVLVCKGNIKNSNGIKYERICLFNNLDNAFFTLTKTSNFVEEYDIDVNIDYPDNTVPATREQKEILFMAMADAGYAFDFEKKELKKIEQKPAWSEEDEKMLEYALDMIEWYSGKNEDKSRLVSGWLKSLKDRVQPKQEWSEDGEAFYNKTIGLLKQYASDNEVRKQSAMSCINWLKSAIKHEKIAKYKIGDRVRFFSHAPIFTITGIDEANERYISQSGGFISFYEELIPAKSSLNKDDIKCGDCLTTEDGTVIKVHDIDENECVHHFYYASKMTEDGGDISNNFMYYCAILSDCRRSTQEEINFLEKWVAHKKYVWVKNNVSPYDEEED